jgi:CheY-like chemotaxis protein
MTTERVLLIEDEPGIPDMLRLFFTMRGYDFYAARTGRDGLDQAARVMPHVILMDLALPDINGYMLTVRLRGKPRTAHIPIIFISKWDHRDDRQRGLALGAEDFLPKPFDLQELLLRVQNSMARAAREYLTDLRTGLPAAFMAREWIELARTDPEQAIIEVTLKDSGPFSDVYGSVGLAGVYRDIGRVLLDAVPGLDHFVGYLDDDHFVLTTERVKARYTTDHIMLSFEDVLHRAYSDEDRARGALVVDGVSHPLMSLHCRTTIGERRPELIS